jgi:hypothetical protein
MGGVDFGGSQSHSMYLRFGGGYVGPGTKVEAYDSQRDSSYSEEGLLDTHEYNGVSVSKCGPECDDVIDCRLDSLISLSWRGWFNSPSFSGYKNNIVIKEGGAHPSRQSNRYLLNGYAD